MRTLLISIGAWLKAQFARWVGCLGVIGVVTLAGYLVWGLVFGLTWGGFIPSVEPTATATAITTAEPTATIAATAVPTATKAAAAKPKPTKQATTAVPTAVQVQPTAVPTAPPATAVPAAPTVLRGDEGPCKGGTNNIHFLETQEGRGNSGWLEYDVAIGNGEVALIWGSQIPGYGNGRSFLTVAGPWQGRVGVFNGAVRQGKILTDLNQTQKFWGKIIDCDLQRSIPLQDQKNGLYEQFKVNW